MFPFEPVALSFIKNAAQQEGETVDIIPKNLHRHTISHTVSLAMVYLGMSKS
jgi:hypothetical protein